MTKSFQLALACHDGKVDIVKDLINSNVKCEENHIDIACSRVI